MKFENKVSMALKDWRQYENDTDVSLSFGNITFLSTAENSHKHRYTEDVIKKYAYTYLGKPIVSSYDQAENDSGGHDGDKMKVVGYIPQNQEIKYVFEDGIMSANFDYVMFKLYASDVYDVLKRDGVKAVSLEQLTGFTEETQDLIDGYDYKDVVGFEGIGVTILSNKLRPSVPNAQIEMTQMSQLEVEQEYIKYTKKNNIEDKILSKLCDIENILNKEDVTMAEKEIIEEVAIVVEEVETTLAEPEKEEEKEKETDDDKVEEDEMEKMKTKCSELEKQVEDYKVEKANYETKITALEKFKADVELSQKQEIIDTTMAKAKELVKETDFDVKKFDTYIEDSTKCDLDNIGAWKNSVMAEVAMFAIDNNKTKTVTEFDVGVPIIKETKKTIYDL